MLNTNEHMDTHESLLLHYLILHFGYILRIYSNMDICHWTRTFWTELIGPSMSLQGSDV
jgi:hypothetical protein